MSLALDRVRNFLTVLDRVQPCLQIDTVTGKSSLALTGAATPLLLDDLRDVFRIASARPTAIECCTFVAAQLRTMGYPTYADRVEELIEENKRLGAL